MKYRFSWKIPFLKLVTFDLICHWYFIHFLPHMSILGTFWPLKAKMGKNRPNWKIGLILYCSQENGSSGVKYRFLWKVKKSFFVRNYSTKKILFLIFSWKSIFLPFFDQKLQKSRSAKKWIPQLFPRFFCRIKKCRKWKNIVSPNEIGVPKKFPPF